MAKYTESELQIIAQRLAHGRGSRKDKALLEGTGETAKKLADMVARANEGPERVSKGAQNAQVGLSAHASRTSDLVRAALQSPDQVLQYLASALRRPLTVAEFAERLEVAPATLSKALAAVNVDFESLRALAEGPSLRMQLATLSAVDALASDLEDGTSLSAAKVRAVFSSIGLSDVAKADAAPSPAAPATTLAIDTDRAPTSLEGWIELCSKDLQAVGPNSYEEQWPTIALQAHRFARWIDAEPSKIVASAEGESFDNPLKIIPTRLLISPEKIDGFPDRVPSYLAAFVAALIQELGMREKYGSLRLDALQGDLAWLVQGNYPGAARALCALCTLNLNANASAAFRMIKLQILDAHKSEKIQLSAETAAQLNAAT